MFKMYRDNVLGDTETESQTCRFSSPPPPILCPLSLLLPSPLYRSLYSIAEPYYADVSVDMYCQNHK